MTLNIGDDSLDQFVTPKNVMPMAERKRPAVKPVGKDSDAQRDNLGVSDDEAAEIVKKIREEEEEVERYVRERERSIGRGVRRAGRQFRI